MFVASIANFPVSVPAQSSVGPAVYLGNGASFPTPPPWWRDGIDFLDIILLGPGGGGGGYFNGPGGGGGAGGWSGITVQTLVGLSVTIPTTGGAGGSNGPGQRGPTAYVLVNGSVLAGASGGTGGLYGLTNANYYGSYPGSFTYQNETVEGAQSQASANSPGNSPGGGGGGALSPFGTGGAGARGYSWITYRQNGAQLTTYPPLFTP